MYKIANGVIRKSISFDPKMEELVLRLNFPVCNAHSMTPEREDNPPMRYSVVEARTSTGSDISASFKDICQSENKLTTTKPPVDSKVERLTNVAW